MRLRTMMLAIALPVAAIGGGTAALVSQSGSGSATATGGYPWANVPCQTQTWTGTLTNGKRGTVCQDDDWGPGPGVINRADSGYGYRNCTDYVAWRVQQATGVVLPTNMGNASNWGPYFTAYQNPPDHSPTVGSIAWEPGGDHVAYVEAVNLQAGTVLVSEYNEQYRPGYFTWGTGVYDETPFPISHFEYLHVPGSGSRSSSPSTVTSPAPSVTTSSPAVPGFTAEHTWRWAETWPQGYRSSGSFDAAAIGHLNSVPVLAGFSHLQQLTTTCGVNGITDGIIPIRIRLTNDTPNFPASVTAHFYLYGPDDKFYQSLWGVPGSRSSYCGSFGWCCWVQVLAYWAGVSPLRAEWGR